MKNSVILFLLPALVCMAAISCSKERQPWDDAGGTKIRAGITEFGTKITVNENGKIFELRWEGDDKLIVQNAACSTSVFNITEGPNSEYGTGKKNAVFWGNALTGGPFTTFYSKTPATYDTFEKLQGFDYSKQNQDGNSSFAHLKNYYCAYQTGQVSYSEISFNPTDENIFASSLFKFKLKLNPEFGMKVDKLTFSCDSDVFYATNKTDSKCGSISMKISNLTVSSSTDVIAYMMASWQPVTIPAGSVLTISLDGRKNSDGTTPMSYFIKCLCKNEIKIKKGGAYLIDLSEREMQKGGGTGLQGNGTSGDPYLLFNATDVSNMKNNIRGEGSQNMTYYKMMDDIDCSGITDWKRLDNAQNYFFNFDGNGKTLSNLNIGTGQFASFFGILEGNCYDVTFKDCRTSQSGSGDVYGCAIVASRLSRSTPTIQSYVHGIKLENCTVTDNTACAGYSGLAFGTIVGNAKVNGISIDSDSEITIEGTGSSNMSYVGGVAGAINNTTETINISNCYCAAKITNNETSASGTAVGGIVGVIFNGQSVNIDNCTFSGTLASTPGDNFHGVGGILGYGATQFKTTETADGTVTITDCNCTSDITASAKSTDGGVGGIAGKLNLGVIERCCMTGGIIQVNCSDVGGIVGFAGYLNFGDHTVTSRIYDCYSTCDVDISGNHFAGGIAGTIHHHTSVWRCYATGAVTGRYGCGGIVGCGNDSGTTTPETYKSNTYRANYAFNKSVSDNGGHGSGEISNGMIIGYTAKKIYAFRCYRVNYHDNDARQAAGVIPYSLGSFSCLNVPDLCNVPPTGDNLDPRPADQGVSIQSGTGITANINTDDNWIPYNGDAVTYSSNYYTAGDITYWVNGQSGPDGTDKNIYSTSIWNLQTTSDAHGWPELKDNGSVFTPSTSLPWTVQ